MTIQINPEQEQVIGQAISAGLIETPDEAVEMGVKTIRLRLEGSRNMSAPRAQNLADLFAGSPFAGLDMDFKRDPDAGREVSL